MPPSLSLETLPVELIYHLFEYLDLYTILFSFRYVCKRFQTIVNSFDQYQLDLRSISKYDFNQLCQIISSKNISSIILTNDSRTPCQIRTFLSRFSFDEFSRLQSLYLIKIEENNLFSILMHLSKCSLQSLTIYSSSWDAFSYTLRVLLSSTIANSNLKKLDLNISYRNLDMMSYSPLPITLKSLSLHRCTFQEYCMILRHTIHLQNLTLTECLMHNSDGSIYQPTDQIYPLKLISFSFGACFIRMKELLLLLSCTPKLKHLKLIIWTDSLDSVIDGTKWENFISKKLMSLEKFEFFFDDVTRINQNSLDLQSYIQSFQTPFWIERNHWYVVCDYIKTLSFIRLYSLPICNSAFIYYTHSKKISISTLKPTEEQIRFTHRVDEVNLSLNETVEFNNEKQINQLEHPVFCRVKHLSLTLSANSPYISVEFLRNIINLSSLDRLSIQLLHNFIEKTLVIDYLSSILKETSNIRSLKMTFVPLEESFIQSEILRSIIPQTVKHLQISVRKSDEIKNLLKQFDQLISVTFCAPNILSYYEDINDCLRLRRKNSLLQIGSECIEIWLGTLINNDILINNNNTNERHSMKRILHPFRHRQAS